MRVLGEMGKVAIIGVMAQVNTLVLRYIASHLQEGAVTCREAEQRERERERDVRRF